MKTTPHRQWLSYNEATPHSYGCLRPLLLDSLPHVQRSVVLCVWELGEVGGKGVGVGVGVAVAVGASVILLYLSLQLERMPQEICGGKSPLQISCNGEIWCHVLS